MGASAGPYLAELCYASPQYRNYPFYIAGGLKILYDVLLLQSFHSVKPASEQGPMTTSHQYKSIPQNDVEASTKAATRK